MYHLGDGITVICKKRFYINIWRDQRCYKGQTFHLINLEQKSMGEFRSIKDGGCIAHAPSLRQKKRMSPL